MLMMTDIDTYLQAPSECRSAKLMGRRNILHCTCAEPPVANETVSLVNRDRFGGCTARDPCEFAAMIWYELNSRFSENILRPVAGATIPPHIATIEVAERTFGGKWLQSRAP
jgi:hypothetical protein